MATHRLLYQQKPSNSCHLCCTLVSGRSRGVLGFRPKPPLRFYVLSCQIKYSNRAVRSRLSTRTVTSRFRYSIAVALLEIMCEKERKARLLREKRGIVKVDLFFFPLNFWLSSTYTPQQNRNPLLKILDSH